MRYEINIHQIKEKINIYVKNMSVYFRVLRTIIMIEGQRKGVMNLNDKMLPSMITIKQAAIETGLPDYFLRKLCITRQVEAIKSGKKYYINENSLHNFLTDEKEVRT